MDQHHGRAHAHAGDFSLEGALVFAVEMRHVGRSAAHVEANKAIKTGLPPRLCHADYASSRSGEDRVLALKQVSHGQPTRRHHEHEEGTGALCLLCAVRALPRDGLDLACDLCDVTADDRGKISVDNGRIAPANKLDQGRNLMAHRYLSEAQLARQCRHATLMLGIAIRVQEDDCDRLDTGCKRGDERVARRIDIECLLNRAVGAHALLDLHHLLVEHLRFDDVAGKNFGAGLVTDFERIAEPLRDQQERALTLALKKCIGGDSRPHLDVADDTRRDRLAWRYAEQVANAFHCGIPIGVRLLRQELVRNEHALGPPPDHICESAAAIDPEVPGGVYRHGEAIGEKRIASSE